MSDAVAHESLLIFSQLQDNASSLVAAISTILIVLTALIVVVVHMVFGLELFVEPERVGQPSSGEETASNPGNG